MFTHSSTPPSCSAAAIAPANAMPLTPPPSKTPSARWRSSCDMPTTYLPGREPQGRAKYHTSARRPQPPYGRSHALAVVGRRGRRAHADRGCVAAQPGRRRVLHAPLPVGDRGRRSSSSPVSPFAIRASSRASTSSSPTSSSARSTHLGADPARLPRAWAPLVEARSRARDRAAPVRAGRDERAHQPRPAGRARRHVPRARHRARGGLGTARRLRARERRARDRRGGR